MTSTVFSIPAEELFTPSVFSAEDLGVDTIAVVDDEGEYAVSQRAGDAFRSMLREQIGSIDFQSVILCLMNDCPYDLYWFGKSYKGIKQEDYHFFMTPTESFSELVIDGEFSVTLYVSQNYAATEMQGGEVEYLTTEVDPLYGQSVSMAAENAARILEDNSQKSDYDKLCSYRDTICNLADYNWEVDINTPYGDPWQLIWVFDGNPNTKVVCEGYAKALQYLCDLDPMKIEVISVQGSIPEGRHMWNIARVLKRNYLIDLTNYDLGHDLFMKGYSDGNVESGYWVSGIKYEYDMAMTERTEDELRLSRWDYGSGGGELRLPEGTTEIEDYAFEGGSFEAVIVPDGCGYIGHGAFKDCKELVYTMVPKGCIVEDDAFEGCERLQ